MGQRSSARHARRFVPATQIARYKGGKVQPCPLCAVQFGIGVGQKFEQHNIGDVDTLCLELSDGGVVMLGAETRAQIGQPVFFSLRRDEKGLATFCQEVVELVLAVTKIHDNAR